MDRRGKPVRQDGAGWEPDALHVRRPRHTGAGLHVWSWRGQGAGGCGRVAYAAGNPEKGDRILLLGRACLLWLRKKASGCTAHPPRVTRRSLGCSQAAPLELSCALVPALQSIQDRNVGKLVDSMARRDSKRIALERILEEKSRQHVLAQPSEAYSRHVSTDGARWRSKHCRRRVGLGCLLQLVSKVTDFAKLGPCF